MDAQVFTSHLADHDNTKHILVACDSLGPFVRGILREMSSNSESVLLHMMH